VAGRRAERLEPDQHGEAARECDESDRYVPALLALPGVTEDVVHRRQIGHGATLGRVTRRGKRIAVDAEPGAW